ncbi:sigma-E processing peptidase SpoIIGA [Solibacillus sp. FSL K6-1523]|uniref:sigma-E processing peptidase SpoIIGA n=1 Tax=Solibacillus sp. FSL K6-1523 TaxID=2921471 RepID=UPI0030FC3D74
MIGELIVLFNFFFNIILLRFTQAVTRYPIKTWRLISSAFCSALIAVVFYESIVMTIFSFIVLIGIAFSFRWSSFYVQGSWLMMGTLLAGGLLSAVQPYLLKHSIFAYILFCLGIACSSLFLMKRSWFNKLQQVVQQQYVTNCEVELFDQTLRLLAYIDTGNECIEPLSRAPVHFISFKAVHEQLEPTFEASLEKWSEEEPLALEMFSKELRKHIRIVPLTTVQNSSVLVPAFRAEIKINEKTDKNQYVIFTKNDARFPQKAQMIAHVSVLTNR